MSATESQILENGSSVIGRTPIGRLKQVPRGTGEDFLPTTLGFQLDFPSSCAMLTKWRDSRRML